MHVATQISAYTNQLTCIASNTSTFDTAQLPRAQKVAKAKAAKAKAAKVDRLRSSLEHSMPLVDVLGEQ